MMKVSMLCFHMQEIAVIETMIVILCVAIILWKGIMGTGRHVRNVKKNLIQKCMYGMGQMNIISLS